jgi:hypothetical protein
MSFHAFENHIVMRTPDNQKDCLQYIKHIMKQKNVLEILIKKSNYNLFI